MILGFESGFLWRALSSRWRRLVARGDAMMMMDCVLFLCFTTLVDEARLRRWYRRRGEDRVWIGWIGRQLRWRRPAATIGIRGPGGKIGRDASNKFDDPVVRREHSTDGARAVCCGVDRIDLLEEF